MGTIPKFDYRVINEFLNRLDCSRSLTVAILLRYGEYEQIVRLEFNPFDYNDLESARLALLATDFLRKHENLPTGIDLDEVAFRKFDEAEVQCMHANERLTSRNGYAEVLFRAQRKISAVLGELDYSEFLDLAGWGPGSTLKIQRKNASPANKFRQKLELTPALFKILNKPHIQAQFPHWTMDCCVYEGNKVITVPKNAKTNRVIAVEPSGNLYFQKGLGALIRQKLASIGVDLNDQTTNQKFAELASKGNFLATVDFSSASDTISSQLVLELLPFNWFELAYALRSPRGYIKGNLIEYEKFSSMGNGFSFELESLIFYALASAIVEEDDPLSTCISIYGDDLIIPSKYISEFTSLCSFVGFELNMTKSYFTGYYRESCGMHYWDGNDITPIYNRHFLSNQEEKMHLHNRLVELSMRTIAPDFRDKRFKGCIEFLRVGAYPLVPIGYGDVGFITSFDEARPLVYHKKYMRGWVQYGFIMKPYWKEEDDESFMLARLYDLAKRKDTSVGISYYTQIVNANSLSDGQSTLNKVGYSPRGKYILKKMWFPDWPCLGQFI